MAGVGIYTTRLDFGFSIRVIDARSFCLSVMVGHRLMAGAMNTISGDAACRITFGIRHIIRRPRPEVDHPHPHRPKGRVDPKVLRLSRESRKRHRVEEE